MVQFPMPRRRCRAFFVGIILLVIDCIQPVSISPSLELLNEASPAPRLSLDGSKTLHTSIDGLILCSLRFHDGPDKLLHVGRVLAVVVHGRT